MTKSSGAKKGQPTKKAQTKPSKHGAKPVKLTDIPVPSRELPNKAKKTSVPKTAPTKPVGRRPTPVLIPADANQSSSTQGTDAPPALANHVELLMLLHQNKETLFQDTELQAQIFSDGSLYRVAKYVDMERLHQEGQDRFEEITKQQTISEYRVEVKTEFKNSPKFSPWLTIHCSITDQGDKQWRVKAGRDFLRGDLIGAAPIPQHEGGSKFFMGLHWIRDVSREVTTGAAFATDNVHVSRERLVYARKKICRGAELVTIS